MLPKVLSNLAPHWTGTSQLHLSWLPENQRIQTSPSSMRISARSGEFVLIEYDWIYENQPQAGALLVAGNDEGFSAGWSDSWHQSTGVMSLTGMEDDDCLKVTGSYAADADTYWGWRIELSVVNNRLRFKMFNISPHLQEELAVDAEYAPSLN